MRRDEWMTTDLLLVWEKVRRKWGSSRKLSKFTNRVRSQLCRRVSGETNTEAGPEEEAWPGEHGNWGRRWTSEGEKRQGKKKNKTMSSLLADVCRFKIQTSLVILVSTDLNLYAHTHSPISRRGQTSASFWKQCLHTLLHLSLPFSRPLLILQKVKRPFSHSSLILPFFQPFSQLDFVPPPANPFSFHPLCSLFAFAQMAGAAEQGQRGKERERGWGKSKSRTAHRDRSTRLARQAAAQRRPGGRWRVAARSVSCRTRRSQGVFKCQ